MPIYVYKCNDCQAEFEALIPLKEKDKKVVCIACGSKNTQKTTASFKSQIKGNKSSGFTCGGTCGTCGSCGF